MAMDYQSLIAANNARIAELKKELAAIEGEVDDRDSLDLELAANRARAYDMGGATTALSRIESRMNNREQMAANKASKKLVEDLANEQKRSDSELRLQQLILDRSKETNPYAIANLDAQIEHEANKLKSLKGDPSQFSFVFSGVDKKSWMDEYEDDTYIGADGARHWREGVTDAQKKHHLDMARYHGDADVYKEASTMQTGAERASASAKADADAKAAAALAKSITDGLKTKQDYVDFANEWNTGTSKRVKTLKKAGYDFKVDKGFTK